MKTNLFKITFGIVFAVLMCVPIALSQTVTGAITGTVTDPSGAVVPGAHVVAHDLDTGVNSPTTTNSTGFYRLEFLPIGKYQVTIDANGFGTQTVSPFQLEVLQTASFNIKLTLSGSTTTVDVSTAAPILDTNDATLGSTFTANTIQNFPLNGLDFSALTLYIPGAVNTNGTSGMQVIERSTQYTDLPNINGNRTQSNNYTIDGIDMNETFNNVISYSPAPEALEEVHVLTANSPADYGNVNGGDVISVLKSGTNRFHGSAYGYEQDYRLNANTWQNNHSRSAAIPATATTPAIPATQAVPINPFSQSQFGGTFGGPIKRNKLFFFVDYLGSRYHTGGIGYASVLTDAMRNGDFSALLANGNNIQLYDTQNGFTPYAGDKGLPILNPVANYLFAHPALYPEPNATPTDGLVHNDYQGAFRQFKANNQGDVKIEYDPGAKDKVTGFFSISTAYDGQTATSNTNALAISFPGASLYPTHVVGSNWVHTFSPSLVNSARVGFTRTNWIVGLPTDPTGVFGITGDATVGIAFNNQAYQGFTGQQISSGPSTVGNQALANGLIIDNTYSYIDDLTWQKGLHYLSMGVQSLRYQQNYPTSNNSGYLGNLNYTGAFTSSGGSGAGGGGYGAADFVLDRVQSAQATLTSLSVGQRQFRTAGYINDDYKFRPNLTFNIGLRFEYDEPWTEQANRQGNIDVTTGQPIYEHQVPAGAPAGSGICPTNGCYQSNFRQWMPRLGFSYQANDKLVIRGGYGATSFYEGNSSNQRLTSVTPFLSAVNVSVNSPTPAAPVVPRTAEQGFSGGTATNGATYDVYPQNIQPAYVQEWSLTTEYALTRTTSLQVGYVGEQGQHIEDYGNVNQYKVNGDPTSAPFYNNQYIGVNAPLGVGSNSLLITESRAMMNYNALQAVLRQRSNHGLEYTLNYTYGKAMTNSLGNYALNVNGYSGAFQNYYDSAADYGPAGYDVTHNVSGTGVYALPVGHGHEYLSHANRLIDEVIGGWKISVAGVAYSGFPETVTTGSPSGSEETGSSNNSNSYGAARVNQYRTLHIRNRTINNWFGTDPSAQPCLTAGVDNGICAFGAPANNVFGTSRNGAVRAPGYLNVDMSAFKDFHLFGEHSLGFRFDAFNAMNIVSYGNPDTTITDSTFGQIGSQEQIRSQERRLQFSARYNF